jgi:hypothetical protein
MSAPHDEQPDPQLSSLLRTAVDAPPLRPGFHDELEARLRAADAAGLPMTTVPASRRRLTNRRLLAAAAVVAAAAVFAFAILPAIRGGGTATAADMLAAMTQASGGAQTVRLGIVTESSSDLPSRVDPATGKTYPRDQFLQVETARFTLSIGGDSLTELTRTSRQKTGDGPWQSVPASHGTTSYDERRHQLRSGWSIEGGRNGFSIRRPAWPDGWSQEQSVSGDYASLAASLRAELAATDPDTPVTETTYLDRPAWRARLTEIWPRDDFRKFDIYVEWDVTVDKATGLLMAATYRMRSGAQVAPVKLQTHVTSIELDPPLRTGWQLAPLPSTGTIPVIDEGTRFGTPEQVAKRAWPTLPLVPQWAPAGYRLSDVASASFGGSVGGYDIQWQPTGSGHIVGRSGRFVFKRVPISTSVGATVLERFRRGFGSFVVQIQPKGFGEQLDDISPRERAGAQDVTLTGGALKGLRARTWIMPYQGQGPTLVTFSDRSQIRIWGDLTRQELVEVANSLKVYGDLNRPAPWGGGQ